METVNVIGVGYIGTVISCYLSEEGYEVKAIDSDPGVLDKETWFRRYSDIKQNLDEDILSRIETSTSYEDIDETGVSIICVNTPSRETGEHDLSNIRDSCRSLSENIQEGHTVVVRSTILPGTSNNILIPLLEEESGKSIGEDIDYGYAPEFVRGGSGLEDLKNPSKQVISGSEEAVNTFKQLFPSDNNLFETDIETAEAVKYFDNVFHGLKVSLANEVGRIGVESCFNPEKVMEILASDKKLNISGKYLEPGSSFGGPCLRKDISAISSEAEKIAVDTPVISSILESNQSHNSWIVSKIEERQDIERIVLVGATYKKDFNSLDESPCLKIGRELLAHEYEVSVYDPTIEQDVIEDAGRREIASSDILIVFNEVPDVETIKHGFDGEILDLSEFSI